MGRSYWAMANFCAFDRADSPGIAETEAGVSSAATHDFAGHFFVLRRRSPWSVVMRRTLVALAVWIGLVATPLAVTAESGETTRELNGTSITYLYSSGRSYNVKFEEVGVSYRYLTGSKPDAWWGPFPYQAMRVSPDVYFLSWFEKGYGDHVTLLVDFSKRIVRGSALIAGDEVHFHGAKLVEAIRP
jgi:hypothetical protein